MSKEELRRLIEEASGENYSPSEEDLDSYLMAMNLGSGEPIHLLDYEVYILETLFEKDRSAIIPFTD